MGIFGRLLAIVAFAVALDFLANALVFQRVNDFSVQTEEADRIAEHLVIAHRLLNDTPVDRRREMADKLSTEHFEITWSRSPAMLTPTLELNGLREQVLDREPDLGKASLQLHLPPLEQSGVIHGTMRLTDTSGVAFATYVSRTWALNLERAAALLLPMVLLILLAAVLLRAVLSPLRRLVSLTARVGAETPEPLVETGPPELRKLIAAFNTMQGRIHELVRNRNVTVAALCHDIRTPLSRLRLRVDNSAMPQHERSSMTVDLDELESLVRSMQSYLDGAGEAGPRERIDLAVMASTIIEDAQDAGHDARYEGPAHLDILARPLPLRRAIGNLVDNAVHYGGNAILNVTSTPDEYLIGVEDNGPGIDEAHFADAVQPFVRLDDARGSNAPGMGLGLAIVDRITRSEGGEFTLERPPTGGLRATICLPRALHDPSISRD